MRRVKNKKAIRRLSDRSFRASRTRNYIAVMAIALTALLFTALFTIGMGTIQNFQLQTMRQSGGDAHGAFKNLTREQYERLSQHPSIKESADCIVVADSVRNPEFLKRHMEPWYIPDYHYPHCFIEIIDGEKPETADEILMDETSMELLGLEPESGQQVTLQFQIRQDKEDIIERTFTICGVIKSDPAMNVGFAIVSEAYLDKYADELAFPEEDAAAYMAGTIRMDVMFSNSLGIQEKLNKVITESGYSIDSGDSNYIESNANWAYVSDGSGSDPVTMGVLAACLLLILLTGYLIIYNIFQISIMRDIRYYGLLKTVGTTGRQIRSIIRRQALRLSVMGIPIGLFLGFFVGKWIVPLVLGRSSFEIQEVVVSVNPVIFIGAALFSFVTVLISTNRPARMAAKVSPVEALRFTEGSDKRKKQKKSTDGGKLWRMALSNLRRNKGKTVIIILSLSLAIILLNSVFTITQSFNMDAFVSRFVSSDFLIGSARYFGMDYYFGMSDEGIDEEALSESFISQCESLDGFQEGGRIYGTGRFTVDIDSWKAPEWTIQDEDGNYGDNRNGNFAPYEVNPAGGYSSMLYGMEAFPMSQIEVWKGEQDLQTIQEKLNTGKYLIYAALPDDNGFMEKGEVRHLPGDKIKLILPDGTKREFEILSVIKKNTYGLSNRVATRFTYYTTAEAFKEMESDKFLMSYSFDVEDDKEAETEEFLKNYTASVEPLMNYSSKITYVNEFSSLQGTIVLIGGTLAGVIGIIGILNFVNSVLTSIFTRQREFAMMEAIGMTKGQLTKMVIVEGCYYAGFTILFALLLGTLLSVTVLQKLADGMWFLEYHFLIMPMLVVLPILAVLGIAVPWLALKFGMKGSVVEELRKDE